MKSYRVEDYGKTWWAEFRTDGMLNSVKEKVVSTKSQEYQGTENPTDLGPTMVALGLPVHYGADVQEADMIAFCTANNLWLTKYYGQSAGTVSYTALVPQTIPTFSPVAGATGIVGGTITIASASADAIYYTTDGSIPTILSTRQSVTPLVYAFTQPIIKAIAVRAGYFTSAIGSAAFTNTPAAVPTSVTLAVGGATPVGGVTGVSIPADAATDNTGKVTGWVASLAGKIKITVVNAASTASTMTINGGAYTSGADYDILEATTLTVVLTTTRSNYKTCVRTFTIDVTAAIL